MNEETKKTEKTEKTVMPVAEVTATQSEKTELKSKVRNQTEETEMKNIEEERQTLQDIDQLAADLLAAADVVSRKSEASALKKNVERLEMAITQLQAASTRSLQPAPTTTRPDPAVPDPKQSDSGCGCGCGEPKVKKCCVEIYGSGIRVLKASDNIGTALELIVAIQAAGVKAVFPGLVSYLKVNKTTGWVKVDWHVTTICVPCDEALSIPLTVEAMDLDAALSIPETGSTSGNAIEVGCGCKICSKVIEVNLGTGSINEKNGKIEIEISARRVNTECCC